MREARSEYIKALFYIGPSMLVLLAIAVIPIIYAIGTSMTNWDLHNPALTKFIGIENYINLAQDPRFLHSIKVTLLFTGLSVGLSMILGFCLALLIQNDFFGKNMVRTLLTIPMIMTPVVSTLIWRVFFFEADVGLINWTLSLFDIKGPAWVASSPYAFISIVTVQTWFMTPFVLLVTDAALESLPKEPFDAAKIDGASYWQRVFHLVIPLLKKTLIFTLIFRVTIDYRMFETIYVLTSGGPARDTEVLSVWVYTRALRNFEVGYANAGSVVMMVIIGIVCLVLLLRTYRRSE
jgi:multiple sugar transport system permease protein